MVSVVLTCYARPQNLDLQIEAIKSQSIKVNEIIIVVDFNENVLFDFKKYSQYQIVNFSKNVGVWGRFAVSLLSTSKYICVFDDDTIPGSRWFENCINTLKNVDGLLGTIGVKFNNGALDYNYSERVGWDNPNQEIEVVDIVGHSWFFKRSLIEKFWNDTANHSKFKKSGEDIHFSYIIKKELNLNTYVPPHPINDTSMWGSLPEYAKKLGSDEHALSLDVYSNLRMSKYMKNVREKGFLFQSENKAQSPVTNKSKIRYVFNNIIFIIKYNLKKLLNK